MNRKEIDEEKEKLLKQLKELETKENEIKQQELEEQKKENIKTFEFIEENKDIILSLLKHSRISRINCSDEYTDGWDSYRGYPRCNKCFLIELLNGEWSPEDYKIDFDINIERID